MAAVCFRNVVRDLAVAGQCIFLIEPAAKVYVCTPFAAERAIFLNGGFAAFWAFSLCHQVFPVGEPLACHCRFTVTQVDEFFFYRHCASEIKPALVLFIVAFHFAGSKDDPPLSVFRQHRNEMGG